MSEQDSSGFTQIEEYSRTCHGNYCMNTDEWLLHNEMNIIILCLILVIIILLIITLTLVIKNNKKITKLTNEISKKN